MEGRSEAKRMKAIECGRNAMEADECNERHMLEANEMVRNESENPTCGSMRTRISLSVIPYIARRQERFPLFFRKPRDG